MQPSSITLTLPPEIIEAIARQVAQIIGVQESDPWLDIEQASDYTRLSKGRIRNLVSEGTLPRNGQKGCRLRFRRSQLDEFVTQTVTRVDSNGTQGVR